MKQETSPIKQNKSPLKRENSPVKLEILKIPMTICKVESYDGVDIERPFTFLAVTDREKSLVCPTDAALDNALKREDGWRAFRVAGAMDFSLVGILYGISKVLAEEGIGIFAVSTFDTDYILTKEEDFSQALLALKKHGYVVAPEEV